MPLQHTRTILHRAVFLELLCLSFGTLSAQTPTISSAQIHNQAATTLCPPPGKPGVNVCYPLVSLYSPVTVGSPAQFVAAGTGPHGPAVLMELWIDESKNRQLAGNLIDQAVAIPTDGHNHVATIVAVDATGAYIKSEPFTLVSGTSSAGTPCTPPTTPGVNVCSPTADTVACPSYSIVAASTGASGAVSHTEVWINGRKFNDFPGAYVNTNVDVGQGIDYVTVVEVDDKGNFIKSSPIPVQIC